MAYLVLLTDRICLKLGFNNCSIFPSIHRSIHPLICRAQCQGETGVYPKILPKQHQETLNAMRRSNTFTHIPTSAPPRAKSVCQAVFQGQREAGIWTEATQTQSPNGQVLMSKQTGPEMRINFGCTHTCHDITHLSQHATTLATLTATQHNVPVTTCFNTINPSICFSKMHILLLKHHREFARLLALN